MKSVQAAHAQLVAELKMANFTELQMANFSEPVMEAQRELLKIQAEKKEREATAQMLIINFQKVRLSPV